MCAMACMCCAGTNPTLEQRLGGGYSWTPSNHPSFFPGRQASINARGQQVCKMVGAAVWRIQHSNSNEDHCWDMGIVWYCCFKQFLVTLLA